MPKDEGNNKAIEKAKKQLGKEIANCRGKARSGRNLASAIGLPPSNMKYIEDGVNAPSPDCYAKLIEELKPPPKQRKKMDNLYVIIRNVPPPDVCKIINSNENFFDVLRLLQDTTISDEYLEKMKSLFASFASENLEKGEN